LTIDHVRQRLDAWLDAPWGHREKSIGVAVKKFVSANKTSLQVFLMLVFALGMWLTFHSPLMAVMLTVGVYIHESGHQWAMRSRGMDCHGIFFLPFFGAVTVGTEDESRSWDHWVVAAMGPLFGLVSALALCLFYRLIFGATIYDYLWDWRNQPNPLVVQHIHDYARGVEYIAVFNLLNLLPLPIFDGGRMIEGVIVSLRKRTAGALLLLVSLFSGWMLVKLGSVFLAILSVVGLFSLWNEWSERKRSKSMRDTDIAIAVTLHFALLIGLGFIALNMSGDTESIGRWLKDH
jgi:Zn-dependent protease